MTTDICPCGRPAHTGWTDEQPHDYCVICETIAALDDVRLPFRTRPASSTQHTCACGCAREGQHHAWGLIGLCYQRLYRAGALDRWKIAYQASGGLAQ